MGKIFYIMGKSASGKDSIYEYLGGQQKNSFQKLLLYTTRPIRDKETQGTEYFFVNEEKYREFEQAGKIIEARFYDTIQGVWIYFTADDGQIDIKAGHDYLGIGTLESYGKLRDYFGEDKVYPIYIEVKDAERLRRAITREEKQEAPQFSEMCRRFLADTEDFSEEHLSRAGIVRRFENRDLHRCIVEIEDYIGGIRGNVI